MYIMASIYSYRLCMYFIQYQELYTHSVANSQSAIDTIYYTPLYESAKYFYYLVSCCIIFTSDENVGL